MNKIILGVLVVVFVAVIAQAAVTQHQWHWYQRTFSGGTAANLSTRAYGDMVFDTARDKTIFFGGFYKAKDSWPHYYYYSYNDFWEREVTSWTAISSATRPSARYLHDMAYDSTRGNTVLFGGYYKQGKDNPSTAIYADTWEWDGKTWTNVTPKAPSPSPAARYGHELVYDSKRKRTVLFGGYDGSNYLNDTWEWDGTNSKWTSLTFSLVPQHRYAPAMAYDSANGVTVLFGGNDKNGKPLSDTWIYDGTSWRPMFVAGPPPARVHASLVYDTKRKVCVLFGGSDGSGYLNDTWEWNGVGWNKIATLTSPSSRTSHAMVYDQHLGQVVIFGGYRGG